MTDKQVIAHAIKEHRLLELRYHDVERVVHPHILGYVKHNELALSGWQIERTGSGWRLFHIAEINALRETKERFHHPAPGYNPRDPAFSRILTHL